MENHALGEILAIVLLTTCSGKKLCVPENNVGIFLTSFQSGYTILEHVKLTPESAMTYCHPLKLKLCGGGTLGFLREN